MKSLRTELARARSGTGTPTKGGSSPADSPSQSSSVVTQLWKTTEKLQEAEEGRQRAEEMLKKHKEETAMKLRKLQTQLDAEVSVASGSSQPLSHTPDLFRLREYAQR